MGTKSDFEKINENNIMFWIGFIIVFTLSDNTYHPTQSNMIARIITLILFGTVLSKINIGYYQNDNKSFWNKFYFTFSNNFCEMEIF